MLGRVSVSLLCLLVISGSASVDEPEFIDLSLFDYGVQEIVDEFTIMFPNNSNMEMKVSHPNCATTECREIKCLAGTLVETTIEVGENSNRISFPFNISCDHKQYLYRVDDIDTRAGITDISLSWTPPSTDIGHYLLIVMDSTGTYTRNTLRETSYQALNLKEKTWYQICIAPIDKMWRTGRFRCKKVLTDFSVTGPLTNVTATSESDRVLLSWSLPRYPLDIPQGIIIYLYDMTSQMCRLYIVRREPHIHPTTPRACVNTVMMTSQLSILEIADLPPHSDFRIEISPFNRNKTAAREDLDIKTKEGESGPVGNLRIDLDRHPDNISIGFDTPTDPAGVIKGYRIRIILKRINICTSTDKLIHEEHSATNHLYIAKSVLEKCASYLVQVTPLNGWIRNGGDGKTASKAFNYTMDKQSSLTMVARYISSNSLTVSLGNLKADKCDSFGLIIEIEDERNHSNCQVKVISRLDCEEFRKEINASTKCEKRQFFKDDILTSNYESFISGIFEEERIYRGTVYKVANGIEQVNSISIQTSDIKDCFTDCYNHGGFYPGIRSMTRDGQACKSWRDTRYSQYTTVKSNICSSERSNRPWCVGIDGQWDYCPVPACSSINSGMGCIDHVSKQEYSQSVTINWALPNIQGTIIGYIIILHNSDHFCEQAQIQLCPNCGNKDTLAAQIKSIYLSCKSIKEISPVKYTAQFDDLHQNRNYNLYITPMSRTNIYEVRNVTIRTKLAKPDIPTGVRYELDRLHEIRLSWQKNVETRENGPTEAYEVVIINKNNGQRKESAINSDSFTFGNLDVCTEYCLLVSSYNRAGSSDYAKELCTVSLAPKPGRVELEDPKSGYTTTKYLTWKYSGSDKCPKTYLVEYRIKFMSRGSLHVVTNATWVMLSDLKPNVNYTVRVRAMALMKTVKNEDIGEFSPWEEFYTGKLKPNISNFENNLDMNNKVLNISWEIEMEMQGSIFMYIIQVKDSLKLCIYSVLLTCKNCKEPWKWKNVKSQHEESVRKLMNCTASLNKSMDANQTSFSYLLESEKEFSNFSVEINGVSLMGIHLLNEKSTITPGKSASSSVLVLVLVFFIIVLVLVLIIFMFMKLKRKRTRSNYNSNELHLMKKPEKSQKLLPDMDLMPKLNSRNLNNKIILSAFPAYYEEVSKNENAELISQYKKLTNESKTQEASLKLTVLIGLDVVNSKKNRFINILPFDQTRVKLAEKEPPLDYINANNIPFAHDEKEIEYIAAQGPIESSISDFWEMIWEQNIDCIVMLTRTMEDDKFKCLQYWPDDSNECISYGTHSQFDVSLVKEEIKEAYIERELSVDNTKCKECRKIIHLQMHTWSDHSAPNLNFFDKVLFRFHEITNGNASNPYLIHCSAGVGRTGTLICIDRIIKELISGTQEIRIYDTVLMLRKYRNFMVQRQAQYVFIHDYINYFLGKYMKMEGLEENIYFNDT